MPTTIAASPYQKENIKLENNYINYLQTNNSENLKRHKRQNNNKNNELKIVDSKDGMNSYFKNLYDNFILFLANNDFIRQISYRTITNIFNQFISNYFINPEPINPYFTMRIILENTVINLVFNSIDFYLQGFL